MKKIVITIYLLCCSIPIFVRATNIVQPFQLKGGQKIWGVIIRQTGGDYTLAMPEEIRVFKRNEIMISGNMSTESGKINELLNLIESAINKSQFERVEYMLSPLDEAIATFLSVVEPIMHSNTDIIHKRKDCLTRAIAYYRNKQIGLPASVRTLQLVEEINDLSQIRGSTVDDIAKAFSFEKDLSIQTHLTAAAKNKRKIALNTLDEWIKNIYKRLKVKVLAELRQSAQSVRCVELIQILQGRGKSDHAYQIEVNELISECLIINRELREQFTESLGSSDTSKTKYTNLITSLKNISLFLNKLDSMEFDNAFPEIAVGIRDEINLNNNLLDSISSHQTLVSEIQSDIRQAKMLSAKGQYKEAIEKFIQLELVVQNSNISEGEVKIEIKNGLGYATGMNYLKDMRDPIDLSLASLGELLEESKSFLEMNRNKFKDFELSEGNYSKSLEHLKNYKKFLSRYNEFVFDTEKTWLEKWSRIITMSKWLKSNHANLPKSATKKWKSYLEGNEDAIFENASKDFFNRYAISENPQLEVLRSFVKFALNQNNPKSANSLIKRYRLKRGESNIGEILNEKIIEIQIEIVDFQMNQQKLDEALSILNEIGNNLPDLSRGSGTRTHLAIRLKDIAESLTREGVPKEATKVYEKIANDYPNFAREHSIYGQLIDSQIGDKESMEIGDESEWILLEDMCKKYQKNVSNIPEIRSKGNAIVERFESNWLPGAYSEAAKSYINFAEKYPSFARETGIISNTMKKIKGRIYKILKENRKSEKAIPNSLLTALGKLNKKFPTINSEIKLDLLFVDLKLEQANGFLRQGQVRTAFEIYDELIGANPVIAQEKNLYQLKRNLKYRYRVETIFSPFGVVTSKDWLALALTLFIWPLFLIRTIIIGRKRGHLRYRLLHCLTIFTIFLIFLACFVYGKYPYFNAFLVAFGLPEISLQCLGFSSYLFFPLVYCERTIRLEKLILRVLSNRLTYRIRPLKTCVQLIENDVSRRENDLPLLHDRTLFKIEKAIYLSSEKPEKGYEIFKKLIKRLNQEIVKKSTWKKHYSACIYNLGAIAYHLGRKQEALQLLYEHIELDPKHIDSRILLSEILFEDKDYAGTIPHLKICLVAFGKNDTFWYRLGRCFFELGDYIAARKCFAAIKVISRESLFFEARASSKSSDLKRAIGCYQNILKHFPQDSETIYFLASSLAFHKEDKKAMKIVTLLNNEDSYFARGQVIIGNILYRSKRIKEANEYFVKALKIDSKCVQAMIGLGQLAIEVNKKDQALSLFQNALKVDNSYPAANFFAGVLTEISGKSQSISYFEKASLSPELKKMAELRVGRINFFNREYTEAVKHLSILKENAEDGSVWFWYLYAYALALDPISISKCENIIPQLIGKPIADDFWEENAIKAMYSIGRKLFENQAFNFAFHCFRFVKKNLGSSGYTSSSIDKLLNESRFRMVVELLADGRYDEAGKLLHELHNRTNKIERKNLFNYYLSLCLIYKGKFNDASAILQELSSNNTDNPRYIYHQIIVQLGLNNDQKAAQLLLKLRLLKEIPKHIQIGTYTIRAYLTAKQGKFRNAETSLLNLPELSDNFAGSAYLKQKVCTARIYYLCQLRDSKKIHSLLPILNDENRINSEILHATAATESKQYKVAKDILKPILDKSERSQKLFSVVCTKLAIDRVKSKDYSTARSLFEEIPSIPNEIKSLCVLLNMTEALESIENFDSVSYAIVRLSEHLSEIREDWLKNTLIHNLAILHLKQGIMSEDSGRKEIIDDVWQLCWKFLQENVLNSKEYWNYQQNKFGKEEQAGKPFTQKEANAISNNFVDEILSDMIIAYIISYADRADQSGVIRHINLLKSMGEFSGNLLNYFNDLNSRFKNLMGNIPKSDQRYQSWNMYLTDLQVQFSICEVLELSEEEEIKGKLEQYIVYSHQFDDPENFRDTQKEFNTNLLDAMHLGLNRDFSSAGIRIENILNQFPSSLIGDELRERLVIMRDECQSHKKANDEQQKLQTLFEHLYGMLKSKNLTPDTGVFYVK